MTTDPLSSPGRRIYNQARALLRAKRRHQLKGVSGPGRHYPDPTTYEGVHRRLRNKLGSAKLHLCVLCGGGADQWAYNNAAENELVDSRGRRFSQDMSDYQPMCFSCHIRFDNKNTSCPQGHEFTPENTCYDSRGHRRCRACKNARARAFRRAKRLSTPVPREPGKVLQFPIKKEVTDGE